MYFNRSNSPIIVKVEHSKSHKKAWFKNAKKCDKEDVPTIVENEKNDWRSLFLAFKSLIYKGLDLELIQNKFQVINENSLQTSFLC